MILSIIGLTIILGLGLGWAPTLIGLTTAGLLYLTIPQEEIGSPT